MTATDTSPSPSPLQQDYQRFLLLGSRRAPHTVHVHETGYRSGTINTDALGLRYSHCAGKRFSVAERGGASRINLLVGGSAALGIGASSDGHTVASHLSMLTGEVWLSLAGCGLNASQELLMFLTHQHRLGQLGHVVVLSGLNTLAHEALHAAHDVAPPAIAVAAYRPGVGHALGRNTCDLAAVAPGKAPGPCRRQHWPDLAPMGPSAGRQPFHPHLHPAAVAALVPG